MTSERWEPVEDGRYKAGSTWGGVIDADKDGRVLRIPSGSIELPDNYRFCRRVEVECPRPDWSKAPAWARWWTVDANGTVLWHEQEPTRHNNALFWHSAGRTNWSERNRERSRRGRRPRIDPSQNEQIEIPVGVDWRTLIERRPEVSDE